MNENNPRRQAGVVLRPKSLVGFPGPRDSITVERRPDGIYCRVSTWAYVCVLAGTALFGPVLASVLLSKGRLEPHTPRLIVWAVGLLCLLSSAGFVRYALGLPRFRALYASGDILYFAWWISVPSLVFRRGEIQTLEVEERTFLNEGIWMPNYCVTATTHHGKLYALCISTDKQKVLALKDDLENAVIGRI